MNLRPVAMGVAALVVPAAFVGILLPLRRAWSDAAWSLALPVAAPISQAAPAVQPSASAVWLTTPTPRVVEIHVQVTVEVPVEVRVPVEIPVTVVVPVYVPVTVTPVAGARAATVSTPASAVSQLSRAQPTAATRTSVQSDTAARAAPVQSLSQPNRVTSGGSASRGALLGTTATQSQDVSVQRAPATGSGAVSPLSGATGGR